MKDDVQNIQWKDFPENENIHVCTLSLSLSQMGTDTHSHTHMHFKLIVIMNLMNGQMKANHFIFNMPKGSL